MSDYVSPCYQRFGRAVQISLLVTSTPETFGNNLTTGLDLAQREEKIQEQQQQLPRFISKIIDAVLTDR